MRREREGREREREVREREREGRERAEREREEGRTDGRTEGRRKGRRKGREWVVRERGENERAGESFSEACLTCDVSQQLGVRPRLPKRVPFRDSTMQVVLRSVE